MAKPVARRGEGRERVLHAALGLFAEYGVSGTSLHRIADEMGVTKAAVYYHFNSKEEIVLAALEPGLGRLDSVLSKAEAMSTRAGQVDAALVGLVDLAIDDASMISMLCSDPSVGRIIDAHPPVQALINRLDLLLTGPSPDATTRVAVSVIGAAVMLSGADPRLADLDPEIIRAELLACARAVATARSLV